MSLQDFKSDLVGKFITKYPVSVITNAWGEECLKLVITESKLAPTIPLSSLYTIYVDNNFSLNSVLEYIAKCCTSLQSISLECIVLGLRNHKYVEQAHIPHKDILDLAYTYNYLVNVQERNVIGVELDNAMLSRISLSDDELFQKALRNTQSLLPHCISSAAGPYVGTNIFTTLGATIMFDYDKLSDLAEWVQDDIFILPSSVHEVVMAPAVNLDSNKLLSIIQEGNNPQDKYFLSNNVYIFSRQSKEVTIAATASTPSEARG